MEKSCITPLRKTANEDIPNKVPEEYRPCIGEYPIPMERAHLTVFYKNNTLAMRGPEPGTLCLEDPDEEGSGSIDRASANFHSSKTKRAPSEP